MGVVGASGDGRRTGEALLAAKLSVPVIRTPVVDRARLLDDVSSGVEGPLTVVSAAAGSGKTLLLATWCTTGRAPGPVAWLTLDADDNEPGVFWAYVIAALRRAGVPIAHDVGEPFLGRSVARELLGRLARALATRTEPVVLVLDQFDVVTDQEIGDDLDFVLRTASPLLRLVLLTRNESPLPLHRYELRGEVAWIRGADLAFSADEAADLLRQHRVELQPEQLAALTEHTYGWAAGLRLSAVAMQRRGSPEAFLGGLPAADAALTAYLVDEVLDVQAPDVRDFLRRTCIVDRLCPALAEALTGRADGEAVLRGLQSNNVLTTPIDQAPGWYRYHPLLVQVLEDELGREHPELVTELHLRASAWFDAAGLVVEAVRHAAAAGDWQLVCATVVRKLAVGALLAGGGGAHLAGILADLPDAVTGAGPAVVRAAQALSRLDLAACQEQVRLAEAAAEGEPPGEQPALLASVAAIRAILARVAGDLPAAESALATGEVALAAVPDAEEHPELLALLLSSVGTVELWTGHVGAAEETLGRGLAVSRAAGCEYPRLNVLGRLAMVEFLRGRLGAAERLGREEVAFAEETGLPVSYRTGAGHLALALVAVERGDPTTARAHLNDAERSVGARHDPFVATFVPLLRAVEHADGRDFRRALAALDRVPTAVPNRAMPVWLADRVALTAAAVHLERGDAPAAEAALGTVREQSTGWAVARARLALAGGRVPEAEELLAPVLVDRSADQEDARIAAWLLSARIHQRNGQVIAARAALGEALDLARPERRRRLLLRPGPLGRDLLASFPDVASAHPWLGGPARGRGGGEDAAELAEPPLEPLTERERAVLACMAQAMSVEDIANDLFISVNTVKTHQRGIYRKLRVSRRNDAVRRARQLGLV